MYTACLFIVYVSIMTVSTKYKLER